MKRRIAAFLLALVLVWALAPAALAAEWTSPFTDVKVGDWFYEGVGYACDQGLFSGMSETSFAPNDTMNRAMLVTCLWRLAGRPAAGETSFADVPTGRYYSQAVAWASGNGLVSGEGDNRFNPAGNIRREQLAAVLLRYARFSGKAAEERGGLGQFRDADRVSSYAAEAMEWAVSAGILSGVRGGDGSLRLEPDQGATRAQVAVVLMHFDEYLTAAQPEQPDEPDQPEPVDIPASKPEDTLTVAGKDYFIGMTGAQLRARAGEPDERVASMHGYSCQVYGTEDYSAFFVAGLLDDKVVALCAAGSGFSYMGSAAGAVLASFSGSAVTQVTAALDSNDGSILHCILLTDRQLRSTMDYTAETLAGESRLCFHLVNAFRQYHGLPSLTWCDKAAAAARLHGEDMGQNNYFSHTSQDGRSPGDRLSAQGVPRMYQWRENIAAGYGDAFHNHDGWVNSSGHRASLLADGVTHLGVGFAYDPDSTYKTYAAEEFYRPLN